MPSTTGRIARLACDRLQSAGRDIASVVAGAGFTRDDIVDDSRRLDAAGQIKLLELAALELHDDCLGLHLAQSFELGKVGLLYYVLASSERLSDALRNAERYCAINDESVQLKISFDGPLVIEIDDIDVDRQSDHHHVEFWMVSMVRICRAVTDRRLAPKWIKLRHFREQTPPDIRSYLGCEIEFAADTDEVAFAASVADLHAVNADVHLNTLLLQYANEALGKQRRHRSATLRSRVEAQIAVLLPHGKANLSEISQRLGMSRRTLARALSREQTTFSEVLEPMRKLLATRYLRERELPISEVAWLLGYREISSFTKAFARWTGASPREYRKSSRAA